MSELTTTTSSERIAIESEYNNNYLDGDDEMTIGSDNSGSTCNCLVK